MGNSNQPSRRSVVRVGANAVWAAPVVAVISAAPAFAACSGATDLSGSGISVATGSANDSRKFTFTITNTGGAYSGNVSIAITMRTPTVGTNNRFIAEKAAPTSSPTASWTRTPATFGKSGNPTRTVTYVATVSLGCNSTMTFTVDLQMNSASAEAFDGSITAGTANYSESPII